ncbi:hypothetical protein LXA43DRAFT_1104160 [Ganoderma leucocontextum]|nr:hypothetical protein LXA43DRAFT_1104160 [Ganoderma leucocontextum]
MYGHTHDRRHFPADAYYGKAGRGGQNTPSNADTEMIADDAHPAAPSATIPVTTAPTPAPPAPSRSPAPTVTVPDLTTIHCVLPAIIPSDAWNLRACSGLHRHFTPSTSPAELVRAFAAIPTARWPIAMRDADGAFPPRSDTTFCTPIADDVVAEVYITSLLPVVPANQPERYSESAFFRGLVELFSLYDVYDWLVKHGEYDQLLVEDPAPYPFDCEDLGLHHVAAWVCSHNIAAHPPLKSWVANYAANVRHLLEGRTGSDRLRPFKTMPTRSSDIAQDRHIALVPSYRSLFQAARTQYDTTMADADSTTSGPKITVA